MSDTCCFVFLVDYVPAEQARQEQGETSELLRLAREMARLHDGEDTRSRL